MDNGKLQTLVSGQWPPDAVSGIATTAMLAAKGIGERDVKQASDRGLLVRLQRGAYIRATEWTAAAPWHRDYLRLIAHVLASHCQGVYSHSSAARLHGLRTWGCGSEVHISYGYSPGSAGHAPGVVPHRQSLAPHEVLLVRIGPLCVPVTSLERTILDCARYFTLEQSVIIGDHGVNALKLRHSPQHLAPGQMAHSVGKGQREALESGQKNFHCRDSRAVQADTCCRT